MKTLRLWLLILLAVLLPVRGALAAAMLCPAMADDAPPAMQMQMQMQMQMHEMADDGLADDGLADEAHDGMPPGCDEHAASGHDGAAPCKLCCAFCSLTPLPGGLPGLQAPQHFRAAAFSEPPSPAPSFLSGGLERPPKQPTFRHV